MRKPIKKPITVDIMKTSANVTASMPRELIDALDLYAKDHGFSTRSSVIRYITAKFLEAEGYVRVIEPARDEKQPKCPDTFNKAKEFVEYFIKNKDRYKVNNGMYKLSSRHVAKFTGVNRTCISILMMWVLILLEERGYKLIHKTTRVSHGTSYLFRELHM